MTYREAFDQLGNRRPRRRINARRLINVLLAVAGIVLWAALTDGWMA